MRLLSLSSGACPSKGAVALAKWVPCHTLFVPCGGRHNSETRLEVIKEWAAPPGVIEFTLRMPSLFRHGRGRGMDIRKGAAHLVIPWRIPACKADSEMGPKDQGLPTAFPGEEKIQMTERRQLSLPHSHHNTLRIIHSDGFPEFCVQHYTPTTKFGRPTKTMRCSFVLAY